MLCRIAVLVKSFQSCAARPGLRDQLESDVFGFWVFLMSDAVIFALLFAGLWHDGVTADGSC
jgi:heme/copper-type cytochrome/quinol oxidase subunit 3